jgi:hypothetical protein
MPADAGSVVTLAEPLLLFGRFAQDCGTMAAARETFQMLVTDLVKAQHPTASTVSGPGGRDWGIDTYVGNLNGSLVVWQSKFVLPWEGETQRGAVRSSFNHIVKEAAERGFLLKAWTLCIPCDLAPEEQKWFDTWAGTMWRKHKVRPRLWNGTELRHQLTRQDAQHIRAEYFSHTIRQASSGSAEPPLQPLATRADHSEFDDALFVRQLEEAGQPETDAARGLFFATEALFRDWTAKGDEQAIAALEEVHLEVHRVWEGHFNAESPTATDDGRMPRLLDLVMAGARSRPDPAGLRLRGVHRMGAAHRLVEASRAGWVTHWRKVAKQHQAVRSPTRKVVFEAAEGVDQDAPDLDEVPWRGTAGTEGETRE